MNSLHGGLSDFNLTLVRKANTSTPLNICDAKWECLEHPFLSSQNRLIFHDLPTPDRNSLILFWNMDKRAISWEGNYYLKIETLLEVAAQIWALVCLQTLSYCPFFNILRHYIRKIRTQWHPNIVVYSLLGAYVILNEQFSVRFSSTVSCSHFNGQFQNK